MGGRPSYGRWPVGVVQHGVEGAGEVVGVVATVVLLAHGHQAGQADEQQQQQVDGQRRPQHAVQEGRAPRRGGGGGGGGPEAVAMPVRTGGNAASGAG